MSTGTIRPSTLDGIKRLAKSLKTKQGIRHLEALDFAAIAGGFENFRHARNVLKTSEDRHQKAFRVFITAYWRDNKLSETGRETLTLWMDSPWDNFVTLSQMRFTRGLRNFRPAGPDHLIYRDTAISQQRARDHICAAARTLQFVEATKLRPTGSVQAYPKGRTSNEVPGHDHGTSWYDPISKRYLLIDEPYGRSLEDKDRIAWAIKHNQRIELTSWTGMYYPGGTEMFLISDLEKGIPLEPILSALEKLPLIPIVPETWVGESAPMLPFFLSPGTIDRQKASRKASSLPNTPKRPAKPRNTIGYYQTFRGARRRPKGKMPIKSHEEVGKLLKSVIADAYHRNGVYNRLDMVRSDLDEWTMREYTHAELPNDQFFDIYYHDYPSSFARSLPLDQRTQHIQSLKEVKKILSNHYPDCAPLRLVLGRVDQAINSMQSWKD